MTVRVAALAPPKIRLRRLMAGIVWPSLGRLVCIAFQPVALPPMYRRGYLSHTFVERKGRSPAIQGPMTASGEATQRPSLGERFARAASVFLDKRVLIILLLGFSSGLPLALSGSTLLLWMKDVGVDLGTIGLFALVGVPYTIKFLWAPIVDAFQVPVLGKALGHRRGWLVLSQVLLMVAILLLGFQDPLQAPWMVAFAA